MTQTDEAPRSGEEIAYVHGVLHKLCEAFERGIQRIEGEWLAPIQDAHEVVRMPRGRKLPLILAEIGSNPEASSEEIAERVGCTRSHVYNVRARLRKQGKTS